MHVHTCPACDRMFESRAPGTHALCPACLEGLCFDDDSPTEPRMRVPRVLRPVRDPRVAT